MFNIYKLKNYSNTKTEFESGVKINPDGTNQKFKFEGTVPSKKFSKNWKKIEDIISVLIQLQPLFYMAILITPLQNDSMHFLISYVQCVK